MTNMSPVSLADGPAKADHIRSDQVVRSHRPRVHCPRSSNKLKHSPAGVECWNDVVGGRAAELKTKSKKTVLLELYFTVISQYCNFRHIKMSVACDHEEFDLV